MKRILLTGASGFIGQALYQRASLEGHEVITVKHGQLLPSLEGLDGVIHLAGEPIIPAGCAIRWTQKKKQNILSSRVEGTSLLVQALLKVKKPPQFFFSASAVGYYGNRGNEIVTETSPQGTGFLADVCGKWEAASFILKEKGIRVIHGRFGNVVDPSGGILKKLLPLFRWGLGACLGTGEQWMSWISRDDLVSAILWIVFSTSLEGPINCCSPNPVTQKEWTQILAKVVHRPVFLRIPASLVRLIFGEMGQELFLSSIRAHPKKLIDSGFSFRDPVMSLF